MSDNELDPDRLARDPTRYRKRVVELASAEELRVDPEAWRQTIAFVTAGEIELECTRGERTGSRAARSCGLHRP